jgi:hypothetical protein
MPSRSPSRPTSDEERQSGHALPCYGADNQPAFAAALSTDVASGLSRFLGPVFTHLRHIPNRRNGSGSRLKPTWWHQLRPT